MPQGTLFPSANKTRATAMRLLVELRLLSRSACSCAQREFPVHWLVKFWIVAALIPFWGAVIVVLLHRLHGDSKLERPATRSGSKAEAGNHS